MQKKLFYLKEDVYFEPLFNHWYAWSYLLPPVTGARHIVNTHRRIMASFVNNFKLHIMASKDSALVGGEFLNCTEDQVDDIQKLIDHTDENCIDLVQLSCAVGELDELLLNHKTGESIDYLYSLVPDPLKGYIEIFMDLDHHASYRLIEPLLYKSQYYKTSLQSTSFGLMSRVKDRPFVFSTPRLPDINHLQLNIDFNNPILNVLFQAREKPLLASEIDEIFKGSEINGGLDYENLFTEDKPKFQHTPVLNGVRLRYLGHAGFVIETEDTSILIDPVIAVRGDDFADEVVSYSELPPTIDYICLTHNHSDHVNLETLLQLRYKTKQVLVPKNNGGTLADPSIRLLLAQLGFNVQEVDDLEETHFPGGRIVSVPFLGEHGDLNIRSKTAWMIEVLGKKCFFGADSSNPDNNLYRHLARIFGELDVLAIGMECVGAPYTWLYGALHTKVVPKAIKNSRRLNGSDAEQAFNMVKEFCPKQVFVYALGQEPWYKYFMGLEYSENSKQTIEAKKFIEACDAVNIEAQSLYGKHTLHLS